MSRIKIFQVTEDELREIKRGRPLAVLFAVAIALLASSVSLIGALLVSPSVDGKPFTVLVVLIVLFGLVGLISLLIWWKSSKHVTDVISSIFLRDQSAKRTGKRN